MDKIRDILFGTQMRDYNKRFSKLEEKVLKEASDLREDIQRRFASLESYFKSEIAALVERDKAEQALRESAVKEVLRELKDSSQQWEKRAGQLDDQGAKVQRELRQQILEEAKRLATDIESKHRTSMELLEAEAQSLRGSLTDRLALADLFAEVSLRLKNEFKVPKKA